MLFDLYCLSVAVSGGVFYLSGRAYDDYLKRNNYVSNTSPMGNYELKFNLASLALKALTPGFNIYAAAQILWDGSKDFEKKTAEALSKGRIRKLTDEEIAERKKAEQEKVFENFNNVKDDFDKQEVVKSSNEEYDFGVNTNEEEYDFNINSDNTNESKEMTLDEQIAYLEHEKEILLNMKKEQSNQPKQYIIERK